MNASNSKSRPKGGNLHQRPDLQAAMSAETFRAHYYYAHELKDFARALGIAIGNFRKTEIEALIEEVLTTGIVPTPKAPMPRKSGAPRDVLGATEQVVNYVGDRRTKEFLLNLIRAKVPDLRDKSGQWYWLNDWRRQRQERNDVFTYQDMADHLQHLMQTQGRLPQIPSARMNNFISDFGADPENADVPRAKILEAWEFLKRQPGPKTYGQYKILTSSE